MITEELFKHKIQELKSRIPQNGEFLMIKPGDMARIGDREFMDWMLHEQWDWERHADIMISLMQRCNEAWRKINEL